MLRFVLLFFLHGVLTAAAQPQNANWFIGHGIGNGRIFQWQNDSLVLVDSTQMGTKETSAAVSDQNGDLLFYTNGCKVFNRLHQPILNGGDIPCKQASFMTPVPNGEKLA